VFFAVVDPDQSGSREYAFLSLPSALRSSTTACWQRRHEKSVMRDVCVLGIGQGVFGKFPQGSVATLGCGAARAALKDAGIEALQLQAIYANQQFSRMIAGRTTVPGVGIGGIEMAKGDNAGAGGAAAVWRLWKDVATGIVDVGIAVGADSVTMSPVAGKPISQFEYEAEGILDVAIPSVFALATRRLMETQGATIQDFAQVSVKAHDAGALKPAAQSCQRIPSNESSIPE
jgi:benzoylsuccinyl-CoA thiolase BbsB subunit